MHGRAGFVDANAPALAYDRAMTVSEARSAARTSRRAPAVGFAAGLGIAAVDAGAVGGHISPVAIVAVLLAAGGVIGAVWGWRGWPGALAAAAPMPLLHLTRYLLGLPDTIQPNTFDSIAMMALFALAVAGAGLAGGAALRLAATDAGA